MCIFRNSKDALTDGVTLSSDDAQRLLRAMKEFMQITSDEQEQQTADGNMYGFYNFWLSSYYLSNFTFS